MRVEVYKKVVYDRGEMGDKCFSMTLRGCHLTKTETASKSRIN